MSVILVLTDEQADILERHLRLHSNKVLQWLKKNLQSTNFDRTSSELEAICDIGLELTEQLKESKKS